MKMLFRLVLVTVALSLVLPGCTEDKTSSVRMGCGLMTFDTVPGWGLGPDGKSVLGPTHGSIVIDTAGNIYTSAVKGVVVFSPDGKVIRTFLGESSSRRVTGRWS